MTVIPADAAIKLDRSFAEFCTRHGWASFEGELATVLGAATAATVARNAAILRTLCVQRDENSERIEVCRRLSERSVEALEAFDRQRHDHEWQLQEVDRGAVLGSLVAAMIAVGAEEPLSRLLDHATCVRQVRLDRRSLGGDLRSGAAACQTVRRRGDFALACRVPPRTGTPHGPGPAKAGRLPAHRQTVVQLPGLPRTKRVSGRSGSAGSPLSACQGAPPPPAQHH